MTEAGIGLISDCPLQRHLLQSAVRKAGYAVTTSGDLTRLDQTYLDNFPSVQAWIVILTDEDRWEDPVGELINCAEVPVLFGLGKAPCQQSHDFPKWERRLFSKLKALLGEPKPLPKSPADAGHSEPTRTSHQHTKIHLEITKADFEKTIVTPAKAPQLPQNITPRGPTDAVERVVILAASLGGPAAVKEFLDTLPAGLPAAFVYAQHIDQNAANVLLRVLGRHSALSLHEAQVGNKLRNGEIVIVPIDREISLNSNGAFVFHENAWPGPYGPSINQVMLNIADYYRSKTYVILFSGMGNDGAMAGPLLKAYGSFIWSQSSASCVSSSMPDAVAATGCCDFRGTPAELAEKLIRTIENEELKKRRQDAAEA